jgi:hypothetical protein
MSCYSIGREWFTLLVDEPDSIELDPKSCGNEVTRKEKSYCWAEGFEEMTHFTAGARLSEPQQRPNSQAGRSLRRYSEPPIPLRCAFPPSCLSFETSA